MRNVYTVKQINTYIKNMFTQDYMLNRLYLKGEVSNCKYHTSGHIYFSLKDESGTIACVMFAGQRSGLSFNMREGQQVIVLGNVSTYERDGKYQLYAKEILLDGAGILYERFEKLKVELEEMGMFAEAYKKPIPSYATKIGIVTAPTGAAIRDIITIATRRNPYVQLFLYPALVQGEGAAPSIVKGIRELEKKEMDLIIIGRGGGSIEDLWAFNEEIVARAIFECNVPIISAVGHETDTTIADYVSDLRAPTPSAAAELAVFEYSLVSDQLNEYQRKMRRLLSDIIKSKRNTIAQYTMQIKYLHPQARLYEKRQYAVELEATLRRSMKQQLEQRKHQLALYIKGLKGLSPLDKLNQGFAFVQMENKNSLKSIENVNINDQLEIFVRDGKIKATINEIVKESYFGKVDEG